MSRRGGDPYLAYLDRFFRRWVPVYDLFAWPIAPVYRAAVRCAAPAPGRTVLDLCTGTGEIALRCARAGATVTGVDVTPAMLAAARRKDPWRRVRWRLADARALPFSNAAFDVVVLALALHDMPWRVRRQALAEAGRVAKERVVVLDYELPRRRLGRRALTRLLALYETAYFPDFVDRGMSALLAAAGWPGLEGRAVRPGPFALWELPAAPASLIPPSDGPAPRRSSARRSGRPSTCAACPRRS